MQILDDMADDVQEEFLRSLTKVVAGAVKASKDAHGDVDPGSVGKRVAAQMWAKTKPSAWNCDMGAWVRHMRGQLGLSQVQFAKLLEMEQANVSRWENGRVVPGPQWVEKIQRVVAEQTTEALSGNAQRPAGLRHSEE